MIRTQCSNKAEKDIRCFTQIGKVSLPQKACFGRPAGLWKVGVLATSQPIHGWKAPKVLRQAVRLTGRIICRDGHSGSQERDPMLIRETGVKRGMQIWRPGAYEKGCNNDLEATTS